MNLLDENGWFPLYHETKEDTHEPEEEKATCAYCGNLLTKSDMRKVGYFKACELCFEYETGKISYDEYMDRAAE